MNIDWLPREIENGVREAIGPGTFDEDVDEIVRAVKRRVGARLTAEYNDSLNRIKKATEGAVDREREIVR